MPRFHFHFHDGSAWDDDDIGLDLPDVEAAYLQAIAAACDMGSHLMTDGLNPALCGFEITTPEGDTLFSIAFSDLFDRDRANGLRTEPRQQRPGLLPEEARSLCERLPTGTACYRPPTLNTCWSRTPGEDGAPSYL